jgi:hypothetical protein
MKTSHKNNSRTENGLSDKQLIRKIEQLKGNEPQAVMLNTAKVENKASEPALVKLKLHPKSPTAEIGSPESTTDDKDNDRAAKIKKSLCRVTESRFPELANQIIGQMSGVMVAHQFKSESERICCAIAAMMDLKSGNLAESLLAIQMTGVHFAALKFLKDAAFKDQTFEGQDANVLRATRLMRLFNEQLDAMAKLKGKSGQQKVTVEHVHVNAGGQAIVGAVAAGGKNNQEEGGSDSNVGNTP